jgi:hypothetical protein
MKHCPDCGKELGVGVVKCWNPDCAAEFVVPVDAESSDPPIKNPMTSDGSNRNIN